MSGRVAEARALSEGLVGHWPLSGDCRDHSGRHNHGMNHGVDLATGGFDGRGACIEVPDSPSLRFGTGDFSIAARVSTADTVEDVVGDVVSRFDPAARRGFGLSINASSPNYSSQGDDRHLYFGLDDGSEGVWEPRGRPLEGCNFVNGLTVFDGDLYVGTTDAPREEEWCHVFRYRGGREWEDCGRLGRGRTRGVTPMIVHQRSLWAVTHNFDWSRVNADDLDNGRAYRYRGGREWEDCGLGAMRRVWGIASFKGKLYVVGDDKNVPGTQKCYVYEGGGEWRACGEFPHNPCALAVHDGRLHVGAHIEGVYAYDGEAWEYLGNPLSPPERCTQIHCLEVYRGELYAGTWPEGVVAVYRGGKWEECGRLGESTEVFSFTVYNGKLYAGTIPHAEVFRYEGGSRWTPIRRFVTAAAPSTDWARATSLTVYDGRLFVSVGSCTGSALDAPCDARGEVFSYEAGRSVSYDRDLGAGWKHVAAVKQGGRLRLHVEGEPVKESPAFDPGKYSVSADAPLWIGFGGTDYFSGRIREVRLYGRALSDEDVAGVCAGSRHRA